MFKLVSERKFDKHVCGVKKSREGSPASSTVLRCQETAYGCLSNFREDKINPLSEPRFESSEQWAKIKSSE